MCQSVPKRVPSWRYQSQAGKRVGVLSRTSRVRGDAWMLEQTACARVSGPPLTSDLALSSERQMLAGPPGRVVGVANTGQGLRTVPCRHSEC